MKKLKKLYENHTGKVADKWSLYLNVYDRIFSDYRLEKLNLLEVGIQNGGSLDIWAEYFPNAINLIGCDINPECAKLSYDDSRISVIIGNVCLDDVANSITRIANSFKIVIDDGSHKSSDIIRTFSKYFGKVELGGVYIVEDLHCSYWKALEGGLYDPCSSISFFKSLADVINHEHWGVKKSVQSYLKLFTDAYGIEFNDAVLEEIHSIEFINSVCVIKKREPAANELGVRVVVGERYDVFESIYGLDGEVNDPPSQFDNPLANRALDPISEIKLLKSKRDDLLAENAALSEEIQMIHRSRSWRITAPFRLISSYARNALHFGRTIDVKRGVKGGLHTALSKFLRVLNRYPQKKRALINFTHSIGIYRFLFDLYGRSGKSQEDINQYSFGVQVTKDYELWSKTFDTPDASDVRYMQATDGLPKLLVLVFIESISSDRCLKVLESLYESAETEWDAVFLFSSENVSKSLKSTIIQRTRGDLRIKFDISEVNKPELIVLIDEGSVLRHHALTVFRYIFQSLQGSSLVYSDEDRIQADGKRINPWFKPQFSPLLASQGALFGKVVALRVLETEWIKIRDTADGRGNSYRQILEHCWRSRDKSQIVHVPHVLFHDLDSWVVHRSEGHPIVCNFPKVSVIIPTRDRWDLVGPCLDSLERTEWPVDHLEIIVVDNGSSDERTLSQLSALKERGKIRILRDDDIFNWSRLNNLAVAASEGELLIFLNNDTEVLDSKWLQKLAAYAMDESVGAVGCKLLFPDHTVQHAGVIAGVQGVAGHGHLFISETEAGYCNLAVTTREVSAVTGACLAVMRDKFVSVGGFNESFEVAFNDIIFCFDMLKEGYRNIYVPDPLFIHYESKSRGYDDTKEKLARNREAAIRAWALHPDMMREDPYYSPNLSLYSAYELSFAPRRVPVWKQPLFRKKPLRIMLLSSTHSIGHGVAAVLAIQAEYFLDAGFEVVVGGPRSENDYEYRGCERVVFDDALSAASCAAKIGVDIVIPHTPPFFSTSRWCGNYPIVICYDHGEPPPEWFPNEEYRWQIMAEKDFALSMAKYVYAISDAIAAESRTRVDGVIPEGNTHLGVWDEYGEYRRQVARERSGWEGKFVVLNVCRFGSGERLYKGVDKYAELQERVIEQMPELKDRLVFVLCGKGANKDVKDMEKEGLTVFANVTNAQMYDMYSSADAYVNFSKWEGFNLGIAQALAMGLPTLASDISAHGAFEIDLTDDIDEAVNWLVEKIDSTAARVPKLMPWDNVLKLWLCRIDDALSNEALRVRETF